MSNEGTGLAGGTGLAKGEAIVTRTYAVRYLKIVGGKTVGSVALHSATPFVLPVMGQQVEIHHEGASVAGVVTRVLLECRTFREGHGLGCHEAVDIDLA
jgi:hypothetical protein